MDKRLKAGLKPDYIVGFVDGEGWFSVSKKKECVFGVCNTNEKVIDALLNYFQVGYKIIRHRTNPNWKTLYIFTVHNPLQFPKIIEFFDKHPPLVKWKDYQTWREFALKMKPRPHYTEETLNQVKELYLKGLMSPQIAEQLGLKLWQVDYIEYKLKLHKRTDYWTKEQKLKVCKLYKQGYKMREIAQIFERTCASINHIIQRNTAYRKRHRNA